MTTELNKIGFEKCLQQLTKQKDKIVDNLRRDEQGLAEAKKTLQKVSFLFRRFLIRFQRQNMKTTEGAKLIIKQRKATQNI